MGLHPTWYALAIIAGVYRMISVCFEAVVRRTVQTARQPAAEPEPHKALTAVSVRRVVPPPERVLLPRFAPSGGGTRR